MGSTASVISADDERGDQDSPDTVRGIIRIDSNSDFNSTNGASSGNGTQANPWIIEDWDINGTGIGACIYIGNTTDYFIIRSCTLYNASGGSGAYHKNASIQLHNVDNGVIKTSDISLSTYGIYCYDSDNNTIYHNIFDNNTNHAYDSGTNNSWDNGYPSGGNYWSDYNGTDIYSGTDQDVAGSDGIGDANYSNIGGSANSIDNYPLFRELSKMTWKIYNGKNYRAFTAEVTSGWDSSDLALDIIAYLNGTYNQSIGKSNIMIQKYTSSNATYTICWYNQSASAWINVFNITENEAYIIELASGILTTQPLLYELPNDAIQEPVTVSIYNGFSLCGFPVSSFTIASELALDIIDYMNETYSETILKSEIKIRKYDSTTGLFSICMYFDIFGMWVNDFNLVAQDGYFIELVSSPLSTSPREYTPTI